MKDKNLAQLGISFVGHNWYFQKSIKYNVGTWGMIFLDCEKLKSIGGYDENLMVFNDWDMSAQLIIKGYKIATWYDYFFKHEMKSKKGGAEFIYKKQKLMEEQCIKMRKKYRNISKIIFQKKHQLPEIRLDWKKLQKISGLI